MFLDGDQDYIFVFGIELSFIRIKLVRLGELQEQARREPESL